jgi:CheY-like chemotaxis protein
LTFFTVLVEAAIMINESTGVNVFRTRKLLVVDDEQQIRMLLKELGERLGMEVDVAVDGEMGLEAFQQFQPDIVILDIYMPRMNGLLAMTRIKQLNPDCPVILITGYNHYKALTESRKPIPDGFILKPFQIRTIAQQMMLLLDKKDKGLLRSQNPGAN